MDRLDTPTSERWCRSNSLDSNLLWMKLAVAVAIIRSKPTGRSGGSHAKNLASQFFQLQECCSSAKIVSKKSSATDCPNADPIGQLTPPSSSELFTPLSQDGEKSLSNHQVQDAFSMDSMRFSQAVIELQSITESAGLGVNQTLSKSVANHIQVMRSVLARDLVCLSEACLCQAASAVTSVLEARPWLQDLDTVMQQVFSLLELLLHQIVDRPVDHGQFPAHRQKHSFVAMLAVFIQKGPPCLGICVLEQLLDTLDSLCQGLRHSQIIGEMVGPDWCESCYFTLQCIERVVLHWRSGCPVHPVRLHEMQMQLDASVAGVIANRFPLVGQAVWRISSLMEAILQSRHFNSS